MSEISYTNSTGSDAQYMLGSENAVPKLINQEVIELGTTVREITELFDHIKNDTNLIKGEKGIDTLTPITNLANIMYNILVNNNLDPVSNNDLSFTKLRSLTDSSGSILKSAVAKTSNQNF